MRLLLLCIIAKKKKQKHSVELYNCVEFLISRLYNPAIRYELLKKKRH